MFHTRLSVPFPDRANVNSHVVCLNLIEGIAASDEVKNAKGKIERRKKFLDVLRREVERFEERKVILPSVEFSEFVSENRCLIENMLQDAIGCGFKITAPVSRAALSACWEAVRRAVPSDLQTGIVFTGFGESELLPSLIELEVDGKYNDRARVWRERARDLNLGDSTASIIPFAQADIAYLIIEGMDIGLLEFIERTVRLVFHEKSAQIIHDYVSPSGRTVEIARNAIADDARARAFMESFFDFRKETIVGSILKVVSHLPKEEMAAMAEALVDITSLRRKVDSDLETVGGPVDVAVITKSDGFVWLKRKYYFEVDKNHDFLYRRTKRLGLGGENEGPKDQ